MYQKRPSAAANLEGKRSRVRKILAFIFSLACAVLILWLLLCIVSRLMTMTDIPSALIVPITTVCATLAVFLAALILGRIIGEKGLIWGALLAVACALILLILGLTHGSQFTQLSVLKFIAFLCGGMIGSMVGIASKEKNRKKAKLA